jgi:hypothetical protein
MADPDLGIRFKWFKLSAFLLPSVFFSHVEAIVFLGRMQNKLQQRYGIE